MTILREVAITGLGIVTPIDCGKGVGVFWDGLCKGSDMIKPIRSFSVEGHKCGVGGRITGFEELLDDSWSNGHDRCTQFFALACSQALEDSQIHLDSENIGVSFGTILGGIESGEKYMEDVFFQKKCKNRILLKNYSLHSIPANIAERWLLKGPNICVTTACSSGADSIGLAFHEIQHGRADIMLAGGADVLSEFAFRGFSALDALTKDGAVRPFDKKRSGLALGEGAGVIVLEEMEHAQLRGAKIYCKLAGVGSSGDAYHIVRPHNEGEGLSRAINNALEESRVKVEDVGYISAHGTGTLYNDLMETKAIKRSFGEEAHRIKVSSIKSMLGHALGASPTIEAISCIKVMQTGMIPPTVNYEIPDPECDLDYVPNRACEKEVKASLSLSAGFGGQNAALIFVKNTGYD